jgi:hypothetical protein
MPKFVVEQNLLGLLVQDEIGGQPNPFKVAIEFLDKTEGRWDRDNTPEAQGILTQLADSGASSPPPGRRWYVSKFFEENFLTPEQIIGAYGLFAATGLWGELIGYTAFVFISDDQYETATPVYLPKSAVDGEQLPWSQWPNMPGHVNHRRVEGGYTIPLTPENREPVAGGIIALLIQNGFTLYTTANLPPVFVEENNDPVVEPDPEGDEPTP